MARTIEATRDDVAARLHAMQVRHRRAEMRCGLLERLEERLLGHPPDDDARVTAHALVAHFDDFVAAERADRVLFPMLVRAASRRRKPRTVALVRALEASQDALAAVWEPMRVQLAELEQGRRTQLDPRRVSAFAAQTLAHVAREEGELVPLATATILARETPGPHADTPPAPPGLRSDSREETPVGS